MLPQIARRERAALDAVDAGVGELGDARHRRVAVGVADEHGGRQERRGADEERRPVLLLRAGLAERRLATGEIGQLAPRRAAREHTLQHVDRGQRDLAVEHRRARVVVRVDPLAAGVVDVLDEVGLHVHALVGDRLDARRHVERAHLVGADRERAVRLDRHTILGGLAAVEVRVGRHPVHGVDHAVEPDDLRQPRVGAVDRAHRLVAQRVESAADAAGDAELGIVGIARVGQRARVGAVDQVLRGGARLQRGGEHEQLDARSGLARRQRQIDLALALDEPAPADHRPDRTGLGVERRDRGIDAERVVGQLVAGLLGARLHERVERRVDAEAAAVQARVALLVGVAEDVARLRR